MFLFICYEGLGGVWVCCDTVSLDLWCGFVEIFRSHFTCQQVNITDKTKSVGFKHFLKTSDLTYTCQLSRLRRESHTCGLKTSISRLRANFSRLIENCELLPSCSTQFPKICYLRPM